MFASGSQLLLALGLGAVGCVIVWRLTVALRLVPRAGLRALALAVTLSPGFLVGHGAAIVPAVLLPLYVRDIEYLAVFGLLPLLVVWVLTFIVLITVSFVRLSSRRDIKK